MNDYNVNNTVKKARKIGAFTAFSMLVGSVVGIGIFLKNNSIFNTTGNNPVYTLIAWAIAAVVCLFIGISFSSISARSNSRLGMVKWAADSGAKKLSYFISVSFPLFYYGLLLPGIAYFSAEIFLQNFVDLTATKSGSKVLNIMSDALGNRSSIGLTLAVGLGFYTLFIIFNYFSLIASGVFQRFSLFIKFIPLLAVAVFGIYVGIANSSVGFFNSKTLADSAAHKNGSNINFSSVIIALPAILFAFDSFLSVGSLSPDIKKSHKTLPAVLIFGMLTIGVLYLAITVGQIFVAQGISWQAFNKNLLVSVFKIDTNKAQRISTVVTKVFYAVILVSVLGVLNGITASGVNLFADSVKNRTLAGSNFLLRITKNNERLSGTIALFLVASFWSVLYWSLSLAFNTDLFIDGITNFPTLFFFLIYGMIPMIELKNRFKFRFERNAKFWSFAFFSVFGFIGSWAIVLFQIFYVFLIKAILYYNSSIGETHWGAFVDTTPSHNLSYWVAAVVFLLSFLVFLGLPVINRSLINYSLWKNNRYAYNSKLRSSPVDVAILEEKIHISRLNANAGYQKNQSDNQSQEDNLILNDDQLRVILLKEREKRLSREKLIKELQNENSLLNS